MSDFHFGPMFEDDYLEEKCSGKGSGCKSCREEDDLDIMDKDESFFGLNLKKKKKKKKKLREAAYDGSAIENDEDPTEPTLDEIVNSEEDIAANYHFGPAFRQESIFHSESKKRYRV